MPRFDGTGPLGQGSLTGRGMGPCGRGLSRRWGRGRGFARFFGFRSAPQNEKEALTQEKEYLEEELETVQNRLKELGE